MPEQQHLLQSKPVDDICRNEKGSISLYAGKRNTKD